MKLAFNSFHQAQIRIGFKLVSHIDYDADYDYNANERNLL